MNFPALPGHTWLVIGASAGLIAYHFAAIESTKLRTRSEDKAQFQTQLDELNTKAKADHEALQGRIDASADARNAATDSKLAAIAARIAKPATPLGASVPITCAADPARVAWADSTR